jgi:hypothetical protein
MKIGVSLKIDVTKIEKARLFKGDKGTYLDCIVFIDIDQPDQYGNHGMITQAVSKDEKAAGVKGPILGNSRVFFTDSNQSANSHQSNSHQSKPQGKASMKDYADDDFGDSEIPF